ncbi:MAG: DUF3302 domain-containing protein [Verrucomicrobiales bacterium]|nr:DUF3302 domain-containing protein [Verrucomicrobiales bacterium]MCP5525877.1 DUF3302 domain-containing protein [Verrucomicrobiales bacterium]
MTLTSFILLVVLAILAAVIFIELADIPGNLAKSKGHPQAKAIHILAWLGLLFGGVGWVLAMVWANMSPGPVIAPESRSDIKTQ